MPAYKDKAKGTWYASFYFENWTGKKEKKMKRERRAQADPEAGLQDQAGGAGVGTDVPATADRRPGYDL